jgi:hypothetical protein
METAHFLTFQTFQVMQLRQPVAAVVPAALEARAVVARAACASLHVDLQRAPHSHHSLALVRTLTRRLCLNVTLRRKSLLILRSRDHHGHVSTFVFASQTPQSNFL